MSHWISVEDDLPPLRTTYKRFCSTRVLVITKSIGIQFGELEHTGGWSVAGYNHRDVTHWMPLPDLPSE